jgi:hypothetical protein
VSLSRVVNQPVAVAFCEDATAAGLQSKLGALMVALATNGDWIAGIELAGVGNGNRFVASVWYAPPGQFPNGDGILPGKNALCYRASIGGPSSTAEFSANRTAVLADNPLGPTESLHAVAFSGSAKGLDAMGIEFYTSSPD